MRFFWFLKNNWLTNLAFWVVLLVPLVYFRSFLFSGISSKMLVFLIANSVLAFGVLVSASPLRLIRFFREPLFIAVSLGLLAALLSTIFSINPYVSFWGNISRASGLLILLNVYLMVFLLYSVLDRTKVDSLLRAISWIGGLVGLYTIGQKLHWPFLILPSDPGRMDAVFGNPLFLGSFLLLTVFLSLYFWLTTARRPRLLYLLAFLVQAIAIVLTASRGPFLALLAGLVVVGLGYFLLSRSLKLQPVTLGIGGVAVIVAGLVLYLLRFQLGLERLLDFSLGSFSIQTRLLAYGSFLQAVRERFWFGYGIDNIYVAMDRYFNPELSLFGYAETFFDRAHNIFIDQLVTHGILGLASMVILGLAILWYIIRLFRCGSNLRNALLALTFLAIFVAYLSQGLTSFDTITNYIYGGILLVLLVVLTRETAESEMQLNHKLAWRPVRWLLGLLMLALTPWLYLPAARSTGLAGAALAYQRTGNYEAADSAYRLMEKQKSPYNHFLYSYAYVEFVRQYALKQESEGRLPIATSILSQGLQKVDQLVAREPTSLQLGLFQAGLNTLLDAFEPSRGDRGNQLFSSLASRNPNRAFLYLTWGKYLFFAKRQTEAVEKFDRALEIGVVPGELYFWSGVANALNDLNVKRALDLLHKGTGSVIRSRLEFVPLNFIVDFLVQNQRYSDAAFYQSVLINQYIDNAEALAKLAVLYKEAGNYSTAKATAEQIIKRFPDKAEDAADFIQSLPLSQVS